MCFGMRGVVLCKSHDVEILQDAGSVFNPGGEEKGGVGRKKGYTYSTSCDFLVQLVRCEIFDSYPAFWWLMNTKRPSLHLAKSPGTSNMRSLKTRVSTCGEECLPCLALLWHHMSLLPLGPCTFRNKLSSSQVVPTVGPSNMVTNTPSGGKRRRN